MSMPKVELRCPFCHAVLAPHVTACHRCHAQRQTRAAMMTPRQFRLFVACWLALALPLLAAACYVGFAPWAPSGQPPAYALALIGAKPSADELVRCRVEVVQPDGRSSVKLVEGACRDASAATPAVASTDAGAATSMTQRRMATALHSALSLGVGLLAGFGLLPLLRRAFLRKAAPRWVRRAAA
ncbi:hypothetical protein [Ramlibacter sp. Leaf400]|uniref:hypothetical protein n=1 Tax=Ramlibacter sp. Leaf400 TaxID=1736365 RepID=UPI0006FDDA81|nr:hypothetical protein [Ramlibacter sp. Leaf400]KQT08121.1 hypothetical protein ASG30_16980 [Ramlibacter sp. Leaf400]